MVGILLTGAAQAAGNIGTGESAAGPVLTDAKGMTLYTFDKDKDGASACYDECAANWPPLAAAADAAAEGEFGLTERTDGSRQWTFKGLPLYTWVKDAKPGDITGDGVKGVWHIAKP
jgi:predicted lipoprotein with Yx(FWY)xxD motif